MINENKENSLKYETKTNEQTGKKNENENEKIFK